MKIKFTKEQLIEYGKSPLLTLRQRKIFNNYYKDGMKRVDIAEKLRLSIRTIDYNIVEIKNKLNLQ